MVGGATPRLLFLLVVALLAVGCRDRDHRQPIAQPGSEGAPTSSADAPAPAQTAASVTAANAAPARLPVRFVPEELPRLTETESLPSQAGMATAPEWRLYLVRDGAPPELVYRTNRVLFPGEWSAITGSLRLTVRSIVAVAPAHNDGVSERSVTGEVTIELTASAPTVVERMLPRGGRVSWSSPDGRAIVEFHRLNCDPAVSATCHLNRARPYTRAIWLTHPDGTATRLDGLGETISLTGVSPEGEAMLVVRDLGGPPLYQTYLVPLGGGEATLVDSDTLAPGSPAWSADGRALAYLRRGDLHVFDRATGQSHRITSDAGYDRGSSIRWTESGAIEVSGGGRRDLLDPSTGRVTESGPLDRRVESRIVSPDGRLIALLGDLQDAGERETPCAGIGLTRTDIAVQDRASGETRVLYPCEPFAFGGQWLPDGRRLILSEPQHPRAEGGGLRVRLAETADGTIRDLTDGYEHGARAVSDPDGRYLLVTGHTLRLYRLYTDVSLLVWTVEAAADESITGAIWSPDGTDFVYIVGPRGFFLSP